MVKLVRCVESVFGVCRDPAAATYFSRTQVLDEAGERDCTNRTEEWERDPGDDHRLEFGAREDACAP
jgi:hypothetical protein